MRAIVTVVNAKPSSVRPMPSQPSQRQRCQQSANRAGQSRRNLRLAWHYFEKDRAAPVKKRRLFKPRPAVEPRRYPIVRFRHIARNPRVARFIGTDKSNYLQIAEIADIKGGGDEQRPANALECRGLSFWRSLRLSGQQNFSRRSFLLA